MMEVTKTGAIELPVIVISNHSTLAQSKHSWSSTIKVPVRCTEQADLVRHVDGKLEESALSVKNDVFWGGVMLLLPLLEDECYAKDLINMNGGIVEIGSGWPCWEPKPKQLHIVWLDKPPLLAHSMHFMLLIGARFVDAFDVYHQQRQLLLSSSVLSMHEQRVAHELKLLLVLLIKSLLNNRQLFEKLRQGCNDEFVLVSIINILVDMKLFDGNNAASFETVRLLWTNGDLAASDDYLRIMKQKVLSDLITYLQSTLALRLPSKESVCCTKPGEMEMGDDAREKVSHVQHATLDIIDLLKHMWQAGHLFAETHIEERTSTSPFKSERINQGEGRENQQAYVRVQMLEIEWKILLAVLGKKDPASFENVLCNIHDEKQRQLVELMAGPLGLGKLAGVEKPWTVVHLASTESSAQANIGAKEMQKIGSAREKQEGNVRADTNASCGYYVKTDKEIPHQMNGSLDKNLQSGVVSKRQVLEPDHLHHPTSSTELGGPCTSVIGHASQYASCQGNNCGVVNLPKEHADVRCMQEQGAGGQLSNEKNTHITDQVCKTDPEVNPTLNLPSHANHLQANSDPHVIDPAALVHARQLQANSEPLAMDPAALSSSQAVNRDGVNLVFESLVWRDELQIPLESHETDQAADESQSAIGSDSVDQAAAEETLDSHIPNDACRHVASSDQATAYGGDADANGQFGDVKVSKARHRKRKNRKLYCARENRDPQASRHCQRSPSRVFLRKIFPFLIIVFVLPVTILGIIWFHTTDISTDSHSGSKQCKAFAKGYLP